MFIPTLPYQHARGVSVLAVESVLVHMCAKPTSIRSWESAVEWLPDLAAETTAIAISQELANRPRTVAARTGYLLQGLRPDIAKSIEESWPLTGKTWFGSRNRQLRYDGHWRVADTLLPFDPRTLEAVS